MENYLDALPARDIIQFSSRWTDELGKPRPGSSVTAAA